MKIELKQKEAADCTWYMVYVDGHYIEGTMTKNKNDALMYYDRTKKFNNKVETIQEDEV